MGRPSTFEQAMDPRMEQALNRASTMKRWLDFVGGGEFAALSPVLRGMKLIELMRIPTSGLAKLGIVPSTARLLSTRSLASMTDGEHTTHP